MVVINRLLGAGAAHPAKFDVPESPPNGYVKPRSGLLEPSWRHTYREQLSSGFHQAFTGAVGPVAPRPLPDPAILREGRRWTDRLDALEA
jgi:hypothetical protein